jgi:hypothetical protein
MQAREGGRGYCGKVWYPHKSLKPRWNATANATSAAKKANENLKPSDAAALLHRRTAAQHSTAPACTIAYVQAVKWEHAHAHSASGPNP